MLDETAVAQSTEPRKEKPLATKNTLLMEKSLYALPYLNRRMEDQQVSHKSWMASALRFGIQELEGALAEPKGN